MFFRIFYLFYFICIFSIYSQVVPNNEEKIPSSNIETVKTKSFLRYNSVGEVDDLLRYKPRLTEDILLTKRNRRWFLAGIVAPSFSFDLGTGFSIPIFFLYNGCDSNFDYTAKDNQKSKKKKRKHSCIGRKGNPFFHLSPYEHKVFATISVSFLEKQPVYQSYTVHWESKYLFQTPFSTFINLAYYTTTANQYFGFGESSLKKLLSPASNKRFTSSDDYIDDLRTVNNGSTYSQYNNYFLTLQPRLYAGFSYDFLGVIRPYYFLKLSFVKIDNWDDKDAVNDTDKNVPHGSTQVSEDCVAKIIVGCEPGSYIEFVHHIGVAVDFLDFPPNPERGAYVDVGVDISRKELGASYNYGRFYVAPKLFVNPLHYFNLQSICDSRIPSICLPARVVFGANMRYLVHTGDKPLYAIHSISGEIVQREGLGGLRTLRGFRQNRFSGNVLVFFNFEARWSILTLPWDITFGLRPFLDVATVYDSFEDSFLEVKDHTWKLNIGNGFDLTLFKSTVVFIEIAFSKESFSLYLDADYSF